MSREIEYMPLMHTGLAIRMDLLNEQQAKRNHGQTITRLKERGGLSPCEALAIAEHRAWKSMRLNDCMQALQVLADNAKPLPEPDAFIVLDSAGDHVYSSPHKQFCHDHINDLLMRDIGVDDSFVVRAFYAEPQESKQLIDSLIATKPKFKPLSDSDIAKYFHGPIPNLGTAIAFARAVLYEASKAENQLYENEAAVLWHNLGKALGYAEPPARSPIPDDEISKAFCDESGVSIGDTIEDAFEAGVRFGEQYHGIKE